MKQLESLPNKLKVDRHFNVGLFEFYVYLCVRGMLAFLSKDGCYLC